MVIRTETGSLYEIDAAGSRFRRLRGTGPACPRVGNDGDWRTYNAISEPTVGHSVTIVWATDDRGPVARPGHIPGTVTSRVVEVYQ